MLSFLEAQVVMLPFDIGGRFSAVTPRDGNYRPRLLSRSAGRDVFDTCFIEGPPSLPPGGSGRVVVEVEGSAEALAAGQELDVVEGTGVVGFLTVLRVL